LPPPREGHPVLNAVYFFREDQRSDLGIEVCWIAYPEALYTAREAIHEAGLEVLVNLDALDRYADLARVVVAALDKRLDDLVEVRRTID
jgi:hypothetical protein